MKAIHAQQLSFLLYKKLIYAMNLNTKEHIDNGEYVYIKCYRSIQFDIAQIKQWLQCSDNTSVAQTGTKFSISLSLYLSLSLIFLMSVLFKLSVCGGV